MEIEQGLHMQLGPLFCMAAICSTIDIQCGNVASQRSRAELRTFTGTSKVRAVYPMATPRFPPAPLMPQNRSGSVVADMFRRTAFLSALHAEPTLPTLLNHARWLWSTCATGAMHVMCSTLLRGKSKRSNPAS